MNDDQESGPPPGISAPGTSELIQRRRYPLSVVTIVVLSPLFLVGLVLVIRLLIS